ncbi:MAG: hypothetical protein ACJ8E1_04920, partial [Xanthobacteraceae bacterium]
MRHRIFLLLLAPLVALPTDVGARSIPVPGIVAVPLQMATRGFVGRRAAHRTPIIAKPRSSAGTTMSRHDRPGTAP